MDLIERIREEAQDPTVWPGNWVRDKEEDKEHSKGIRETIAAAFIEAESKNPNIRVSRSQ